MKQLYTSFSKKLFFVITTLATVMATNTFAQCVQPYKVFESFKAFTPALTGTATAPGSFGGYTLGVTGSDNWRGNGVIISGTSASPVGHSGFRSLSFNTATGYLITPKIVSPTSGTMTLGFYYRSLTAATSQLIVEYSSNYGGGGADPALSTWIPLGATLAASTLTTSSTAYTASPLFPFSPGTSGFYIRIRRANATGAVPNIDSLSWYSSDATENLQLVLPVGSVATSCTYNIATGLVYRFFDSGGFDDNSNTTASAINSTTFMPPAGQQINLNFVTYATLLPGTPATISSSNTSPALNHSLASAPTGSPYLSTDTGDGNVKVDYTVNGITAAGFEITIEAKPLVSTCSDVSGVAFTTGSESFNGASISWTAPGVLPSDGYDYYVATTATPLPDALTTPTGNVSNSLPSATITGLLSDTTYFVWVRSNCGVGNLGSWKQGATTFRTLCEPFPIPYTENFNGLNGPIPTCTSRVRSWATNISNGSLFTNDASTTPYPMFFSKPVSLVAGTTYRLSYDYSTTVGSGTANFNVYYGTTNTPPTQANINTLLASYVGISSLTGNIVNFTAPSTGTFYIGFLLQEFSIPSTTVFNLDNIVLDVEQCLPPAVSNSGVTSTGATVSWTAPTSAPASGYQYLVTTSSTAPTYTDPSSGRTPAGVTTVNLSLTPGTTYYVWVRSNCGGTFSTWASTNFTTLPLPLSTGVNMSNGTLTICGASAFGSAVFFDSGGSTNTYLINEDFTYTFRPNVTGSKLKVVFSSFNTENRYDGLSIFNGPSVASPLISSGLPAGIIPATCPAGSFYGTNSPGTIYSSSPNGEITFRFTSDDLINSSGWAATVTCVTVPVITSFLPSDNSCDPISTPTIVTLRGSNFSGVTSVKFNGVSAFFTPVNPTTITAILPAGASTGIISVSNIDATGFSTTSFTVYAPAPDATGSTICAATEPGVLSSTTDCTGFVLPVSTISGAWAATDPIENRPTGSANSTTCGFTTTEPRGYTSIEFQVSQTGTYTFEMSNDANFDGMGYITSGAFVPGSCSSGSFIIGDDDSSPPGNEPLMSAVLTAGVTYTLYSTYYFDIAPTYYNYTWNISTTSSGRVLLFDTAPVEWFTAASGGTAIGSGSPFNPVGVAGSGLTTSSAAGNYTFYAACPSNPTCRKAVVIVVKPAPTVTPPANAIVCPNTIKALTVSGTALNYTWSASPSGTLYTDANASILYTSGTATTVYLKTASTVVVTITGTLPASCSTVVTTTQTVQSKIWNGTSWVGGAPTATDGIIFNGSGNAFGSLQGCSCSVTNGNVVFNNGETLTLLNDLSVIGGTLTFENGASLVQLNTPSSNTNTGNITYKRSTFMRKFDYTYWSSPVGAQSLFNLSSTTLSDKYFSWNTTIYNWENVASSTIMAPGKGYIIRGPQGYSDTILTAFTGIFQGIPNNGNYSVSITKSALGDFNLIGNPYPSAVDASAFILGNSSVFGGGTTLYFWTHNTPITNFVYVDSDYAAWNFSGGIGNGVSVAGANNATPSGKIAAGQGFVIKGINMGTQTATFRNSMRIAGNNTNFYRTQEDFNDELDAQLMSQSATVEGLERHRIWLDLTNDQGVFKEVLLAYVENATNNYEESFDGDIIDFADAVGFYSKLSSHKLSIQGRALPFDVTDIVPLGMHLPVAGSYNIKLSNFDGLFADATTPVYLEDQLLHVVHNLRQGSYSFISESGIFEDRFLLRYTAVALDVPVFAENTVVVYKNETGLTINSGSIPMKSVAIYDVTGRLITSQKEIYATQTRFTTLPSTNQVLLVQITSETGVKVTKKVVY